MSLLLTHFSLANKNIRITQKYKVNKTYHVYFMSELNNSHPPSWFFSWHSKYICHFRKKNSANFFLRFDRIPAPSSLKEVVSSGNCMGSAPQSSQPRLWVAYIHTPGDGMMGYLAFKGRKHQKKCPPNKISGFWDFYSD